MIIPDADAIKMIQSRGVPSRKTTTAINAMICSLFHIGIEDIIELEDTDPASKKDADLLINEITATLDTLNHSQLSILKKFLEEIIPYIK